MESEQITQELRELEKGWSIVNYRLYKRFDFSTYLAGADFVVAIAKLAEKCYHHPELVLGFREVEVKLVSQDINEISERDFKLAKQIDQIKH